MRGLKLRTIAVSAKLSIFKDIRIVGLEKIKKNKRRLQKQERRSKERKVFIKTKPALTAARVLCSPADKSAGEFDRYRIVFGKLQEREIIQTAVLP